MASAFFKLVSRLEKHNSAEASSHLVAVLATVAHALVAPQPFSWFSQGDLNLHQPYQLHTL